MKKYFCCQSLKIKIFFEVKKLFQRKEDRQKRYISNRMVFFNNLLWPLLNKENNVIMHVLFQYE